MFSMIFKSGNKAIRKSVRGSGVGPDPQNFLGETNVFDEFFISIVKLMFLMIFLVFPKEKQRFSCDSLCIHPGKQCLDHFLLMIFFVPLQ